MKRRVTIGLAGFGVVGSGTLQLLKKHAGVIAARVGAPVEVAWILSRKKKRSPLIDKNIRQTNRWQDLIKDPKVDCVVELLGGIHPAKDLVMAALQAGKHVVTANKAILSKHWNEIFGAAHKHRTLVYFEAAVGGGVPVVQALNEGLAGNEIQKIVGILNGTTNFILTRMQEAGLGFKDALKEAQEKGFAEADPTFDIEGIDAAQKISILGSLATGQWISPSRVHAEGISRIQSIDIRLIRERLHSVIKLLGIAEKTPHGWIFRVHPALVPLTHPFANVRNEYNAISLRGDAAEDVMLYGKGAGRLPTSSAVVSDIIFLCRQIVNSTAGRLPYVSRFQHNPVKFGKMADVEGSYYLRVSTQDKSGVLAKITGILGKHKVSIASLHQDTFEEPAAHGTVPVVLLTHESSEANIQSAVKEIDRLKAVTAKTVLIRMA